MTEPPNQDLGVPRRLLTELWCTCREATNTTLRHWTSLWVTGNLTATLFDLRTITDDNRKDELSGEHGNHILIGGIGDQLKQQTSELPVAQCMSTDASDGPLGFRSL